MPKPITKTHHRTPTTTATLRVVEIVRNHSMRHGWHQHRAWYRSHLADRTAVLCFNRALTIARLYDCAGGVHNYYSDAGKQFDVAKLNDLLGGVGLVVKVTLQEAPRG